MSYARLNVVHLPKEKPLWEALHHSESDFDLFGTLTTSSFQKAQSGRE
jgi:hypothetical protein